jgi:hypothetical protein
MVLEMEAYANRELNELPSFVEAMRQCTEIEIRKYPNRSILADEVKNKSEKDWKECMESQFINLPTESDLRINQEGQWKMRLDALVEMMKGNEQLRKFASNKENGNIKSFILKRFFIQSMK